MADYPGFITKARKTKARNRTPVSCFRLSYFRDPILPKRHGAARLWIFFARVKQKIKN
jgi:hypothetical protein